MSLLWENVVRESPLRRNPELLLLFASEISCSRSGDRSPVFRKMLQTFLQVHVSASFSGHTDGRYSPSDLEFSWGPIFPESYAVALTPTPTVH